MKNISYTPFAAPLPPAPIELGRSHSLSNDNVEAPLRNEDIFRAFVAMAKDDPEVLNRLAAVFKHEAPFRKVKAATPMPLAIKTIEISLDDQQNASRKPRKNASQNPRVRADQLPLRWQAVFQVTTTKTNTVSQACWSGEAQFRDVTRLQKDAATLLKKKQITQSYYDWLISDIVPLATAHGLSVGLLRIRSEEAGKPFSTHQVALMDEAAAARGDLDQMMLIDHSANTTTMINAPRFVATTSKGAAFGGGFVLQSRGAREGDKLGWATGVIKVARH